jgi:hypothetical protein
MVGLALALFSMPFVSGLFTAFRVPLTTRNVLLREIIFFALAALVLFIIRRKEHLGWDSVGLQRPALGNTFKWILITFCRRGSGPFRGVRLYQAVQTAGGQ